MQKQSTYFLAFIVMTVALSAALNTSQAEIEVEKWKTNPNGNKLRSGQLEKVYTKAEVDEWVEYLKHHASYYDSKAKRVRFVEQEIRKRDKVLETHKTQLTETKTEILAAINKVLGQRLTQKEQQQMKGALREELVKEINEAVVPRVRDEVKKELLTDTAFLNELAKRIPTN